MSTDHQQYFSDNDLDWLAFCYVNDELEANPLASFELRLSEDQSAREAVERAVNRQILISAGLQAARAESYGSVSTAQRKDRDLNQGRRLLVPKFMFAAAATLLVAAAAWMQWGHFLQTKKPLEVVDKGSSNSEMIEAEEWIGNEEYANQLVEALVASEPELDLDAATEGEFSPVTLQGDWMQDVFSELGDEWIDLEDFDESELESTESDRSWG